ncbi:MAG: alpha/beta hydrolase [Xanthobacteraceae bacterium]
MSANFNDASPTPAPFVDQLPNGPGVSTIDPAAPAAPMYRLLAKMRSPVALRDLMIRPVRAGYIGQERPIDPAELPKSAAELYPEIRVSEVAVPSPIGRIRCQVFSPHTSRAPSGDRRPMMLYLHGGGFTVGQSEDTAYITSRIAAENAIVVVSANYRLAPEWPFPACLDDCLAVLQWMQNNDGALGGEGTRIVVGGDSAGGNLAAALPIKARDAGSPPPQATVLLAPITDFFFEEHLSFERLAPVGIVYDSACIGFIRGAYLVHGRNWAHPHASPARADLRNYPPALIVSGTADPLVDDNRAFADKLRAAGGTRVEHFIREGMPHGFYFFPGMFKQGDEAFTALATFLGRTFAA